METPGAKATPRLQEADPNANQHGVENADGREKDFHAEIRHPDERDANPDRVEHPHGDRRRRRRSDVEEEEEAKKTTPEHPASTP